MSKQRDNDYNDPTELESKTVLIQNKRFYLDVKENQRGKFLKIAEVTPGGHKNRVTMGLEVLPEFRDHMSDFIDYYACLGPRKDDEGAAGDGEDYKNMKPLKSAKMMRGQRRYFLDLKENSRGRYLRVRAPGQNYSDIPQQQIVLPASGMIEFRDTLTGLIDQFDISSYVPEKDNRTDVDLPDSAAIGNRRTKMFYMDVDKNARGIYVRMTEQSQNYRASITVPEEQFRAIGEWFLNAASSIESAPSKPVEQNSRRRSRDDDDYSD